MGLHPMFECFNPITERELNAGALLMREVYALLQRRAKQEELDDSKVMLSLLFLLVHCCDPAWNRAMLRAQFHELIDHCLELRERGELEMLFAGMLPR